MIFPCYRLIEEKTMQDGVYIPPKEDLYCIKSEDDVLFLIYESKKKDIFIFWSRLEDVEYIGEKEKEFDLNIQEISKGNYFNLI